MTARLLSPAPFSATLVPGSAVAVCKHLANERRDIRRISRHRTASIGQSLRTKQQETGQGGTRRDDRKRT
jgi:hypothetical protein